MGSGQGYNIVLIAAVAPTIILTTWRKPHVFRTKLRFALVLSALNLPAIAQEPTGNLSPPVSEYKSVLNRYCFTCHNEKLKTADLVLSAMDVQNPAADPAVWEKVVRKLRTGQMPPAGLPRPDAAFYNSFATYLETALDRAAAA